MATKRPPPGDIDQKSFQYKETPQPDNANSSAQRTQIQIQRRIVKVNTQALDKAAQQPAQQKLENQQASQKQQDKPAPLFSNLFQNSGITKGNMFANPPSFMSKDQSGETNKIDLSKNNLFSNNGYKPQTKKPTSFFSNGSSEAPNLFANFKNSQGFSSIFNFNQPSNIPPVRNGQEDDEDGNSAQLEKNQSMVIDKSKSKGNYDYGQQVKVLFSGNVKKYKKNNGDLMQNVEVLLQHQQKNHVFYLIVRLIATKKNIFTGYVLQGKSEVRVINKKDQNLQVSVFVINTGKKAELNKVKLQLDTAENGKTLKSCLQQIIEGKIKPVELKQEQPAKKEEKEEKEKEEKGEKQEQKKEQANEPKQ